MIIAKTRYAALHPDPGVRVSAYLMNIACGGDRAGQVFIRAHFNTEDEIDPLHSTFIGCRVHLDSLPFVRYELPTELEGDKYFPNLAFQNSEHGGWNHCDNHELIADQLAFAGSATTMVSLFQCDWKWFCPDPSIFRIEIG